MTPKYNTTEIIYVNGKHEKISGSMLTPTGTEMRNTGAAELRKVLQGDGRRLLVYERGGKTRIIMPSEVRDILVRGKSVFINEDDGHRCGVWCDRC